LLAQERKRSIKNWLEQLRENKAGAFETKALKHGVTAGSIAAIAASQINAYYNKHNVTALDISRKHLAELFSVKALERPNGQAPTIKPWIRERLRSYGIRVVHSGGYVSFQKIKQKVNPQV